MTWCQQGILGNQSSLSKILVCPLSSHRWMQLAWLVLERLALVVLGRLALVALVQLALVALARLAQVVLARLAQVVLVLIFVKQEQSDVVVLVDKHEKVHLVRSGCQTFGFSEVHLWVDAGKEQSVN